MNPTTIRAYQGARRVGFSRFTAPRRSIPRRSYADQSNSSSSSGGGMGQAVTGGMVGGVIVLGLSYGYYRTSGLATIADQTSKTKKYLQETSQSLKQSAPEPNEAFQWLRDTALSYAAVIPGAKKYVNAAFDDLDAINNKHGDKVSQIATDAYREIRDATQGKEVSLETAQQVWSIMQKHMAKIAELAEDSAEEIMNRHPEIRNKVGGNMNELKKLGDQYGPEAKKQVDETWKQIESLFSKGISASSISDARQIVEEKVEKLKNARGDLFDKGLEQAKPYLDKSPKAKELILDNKDALMKGDVQTLWSKAQDAVNKGDTGDLEKFVKRTIEQAQSSGGGAVQAAIDKALKNVPGGENIGANVTQLVEAGQKHGDEAQNILRSAMKEIEQVLNKKVDEARKLKDKAKKDT